jgi:hypothetical protein
MVTFSEACGGERSEGESVCDGEGGNVEDFSRLELRCIICEVGHIALV